MAKNKKKKRILVLGSSGQLGTCLQKAPSARYLDITFLSRKDIDFLSIGDMKDVEKVILKYNPSIIVNCVAYTDTWKAEKDAEVMDIQETDNWKINAGALKYVAEYCNKHSVHFIHISTDFVYEGNRFEKYKESDANPLTAYGIAKYNGEWFVRNICEKYTIFRTSWLMSDYGYNFLNKIKKQIKDGIKEISLPYDEYCNPTYAPLLAEFILGNIERGYFDSDKSIGVFNATNCWEVPIWSRYEFGKQIFGDIVTILPKERGDMDNRPQYVNMDTTRLKECFNTKTLTTSFFLMKYHYLNVSNLSVAGDDLSSNQLERYKNIIETYLKEDSLAPRRNALNTIVYQLWDIYKYYPMITPRIDGWFRDFQGFHFNIWKQGDRKEIETFHNCDSFGSPEEAYAYAILDIIDLIEKQNGDN